MKLLLTTVAAILMATSSFAAEVDASVEMKVAENDAHIIENLNKTFLGLSGTVWCLIAGLLYGI